MTDTRPCSCAPDERPYPCQHQYALGLCRKAEIRSLRAELDRCIAQIGDLAKMVIKFGKRYEKAEAERDALAAENLTLRNAAVSATEERDAYREKFNAQCYQADEQTLQRSQTDRDNAALRALLDRVLSCTDLRGWNGAKAELLCDEIDAVLKDKP